MENEYIHVTRDGRCINIKDMSDNHLKNTIHFIERYARELFIDIYFEDDPIFWYSDRELYEDILKELNYEYYINEQKERELDNQW